MQPTYIDQISPIDGFIISSIDLSGAGTSGGVPRSVVVGNEGAEVGPRQGLLSLTSDNAHVSEASLLLVS